MKKAAAWSFFWISCALLFNLGIWFYLGHDKAIEFLTGYLIEKSLSVDNLFVFFMIFKAVQIPLAQQHRVLMYGIVGAIVFRIMMILFGVWLVKEFHWILYVFGAFLMLTAIKMFRDANNPPETPKLIAWLQRRMRIKPFFLAILLVETADIVFAVDSIPAILAITTDPFIIITSNIFAILGLRSLYFLLAEMVERFHLLKYGLSVILFFVGTKMLIVPWIKIPTLFSLGVIVITLTVCMTWRKNNRSVV
ncbi:MAG: TerC family protein [Gammaproteobacteria bacterium]